MPFLSKTKCPQGRMGKKTLSRRLARRAKQKGGIQARGQIGPRKEECRRRDHAETNDISVFCLFVHIPCPLTDWAGGGTRPVEKDVSTQSRSRCFLCRRCLKSRKGRRDSENKTGGGREDLPDIKEDVVHHDGGNVQAAAQHSFKQLIHSFNNQHTLATIASFAFGFRTHSFDYPRPFRKTPSLHDLDALVQDDLQEPAHPRRCRFGFGLCQPGRRSPRERPRGPGRR